jgi:hypothetical protein
MPSSGRPDREKEYISGDIENVERYLNELFHVPVGVCIADTQDIVLDVLGYEISDMHREPNTDCRTVFQHLARIEWAPWNDGGYRGCERTVAAAQGVDADEAPCC